MNTNHGFYLSPQSARADTIPIPSPYSPHTLTIHCPYTIHSSSIPEERRMGTPYRFFMTLRAKDVPSFYLISFPKAPPFLF
ncbi:MAG TPA: hypothetical protein VFU62_05875, partial [Hanamia sp.]|nr:hypothetical protein [Hanamia sp.]